MASRGGGRRGEGRGRTWSASTEHPCLRPGIYDYAIHGERGREGERREREEERGRERDQDTYRYRETEMQRQRERERRGRETERATERQR